MGIVEKIERAIEGNKTNSEELHALRLEVAEFDVELRKFRQALGPQCDRCEEVKVYLKTTEELDKMERGE